MQKHISAAFWVFTIAILVAAIIGCQAPGSSRPAGLTLTTQRTIFGPQIVALAGTSKEAVNTKGVDRDLAAQPSGVTFSIAPSTTAATIDSATGLVTPISTPPRSVTVVAISVDGSSTSISVALVPIDLANMGGIISNVTGSNAVATVWKVVSYTLTNADYGLPITIASASQEHNDPLGTGASWGYMNLTDQEQAIMVANSQDETVTTQVSGTINGGTPAASGLLSTISGGIANRLNAGFFYLFGYNAGNLSQPFQTPKTPWQVVDHNFQALTIDTSTGNPTMAATYGFDTSDALNPKMIASVMNSDGTKEDMVLEMASPQPAASNIDW